MKFKSLIILFVILLSLFPVISGNGLFSSEAKAAVTENTAQIDLITIVSEYHDGKWWLVGYNEYGEKIFEIEDPRE